MTCCPEEKPYLRGSERDGFLCTDTVTQPEPAFAPIEAPGDPPSPPSDDAEMRTRQRQLRQPQRRLEHTELEDHAGYRLTRDEPAGCRNGNNTDTEADRARCVVVRLSLPNNRLDGPLTFGDLATAELRSLAQLDLSSNALRDGGFTSDGGEYRESFFGNATQLLTTEAAATEAPCQLTALRELDLASNRIGGPLPAWVAQCDALERIRLYNNSFLYPHDDESAQRAVLDGLLEECQELTVSCTGLPPLSCNAFGVDYVADSTDNSRCIRCTDPLLPLIGVGAVFVLALGALGFYTWLIQRYPQAMQQSVATATLIIDHLQTVSIVGNLKLLWPPAVHAVTSSFSFNVLEMMSAIRPECILRDAQDLSPFYIFNLVVCAIVFVLLLATMLVGSLLELCGRPAMADEAELAGTVLFTAQLTVAWRVCQELILSAAAGGPVFGPIAALAGISLLGLQLLLVLKYVLQTKSLRRNSHGQRAGEGACLSRLVGKELANSPKRVRHRLSYLMERFSDRKPYWQYVIWLRQLLLTLDYILPQVFAIDDMDDLEALKPMRSADDNGTSDEVGNTPTWVLKTLMSGEPEKGWRRAVVLGHAVVAVLIFACFWRASVKHKPYRHGYQNAIESWLFFSDIVVVLLGTVYTFLPASCEFEPRPDPCSTERTTTGVEAAIMVVMVGAITAAALYLAYGWWVRHMLESIKPKTPRLRGKSRAQSGYRSNRASSMGGPLGGGGGRLRGVSASGFGLMTKRVPRFNAPSSSGDDLTDLFESVGGTQTAAHRPSVGGGPRLSIGGGRRATLTGQQILAGRVSGICSSGSTASSGSSNNRPDLCSRGSSGGCTSGPVATCLDQQGNTIGMLMVASSVENLNAIEDEDRELAAKPEKKKRSRRVLFTPRSHNPGKGKAASSPPSGGSGRSSPVGASAVAQADAPEAAPGYQNALRSRMQVARIPSPQTLSPRGLPCSRANDASAVENAAAALSAGGASPRGLRTTNLDAACFAASAAQEPPPSRIEMLKGAPQTSAPPPGSPPRGDGSSQSGLRTTRLDATDTSDSPSTPGDTDAGSTALTPMVFPDLDEVLRERAPPSPAPKKKKGRAQQGAAVHTEHTILVQRAEEGIGMTLNEVGRITSVDPGSPAEAAGLQKFDLVTQVDGEPLSDSASLSQRLAGRDQVLLGVERPPTSMHRVIASKENRRAKSSLRRSIVRRGSGKVTTDAAEPRPSELEPPVTDAGMDSGAALGETSKKKSSRRSSIVTRIMMGSSRRRSSCATPTSPQDKPSATPAAGDGDDDSIGIGSVALALSEPGRWGASQAPTDGGVGGGGTDLGLYDGAAVVAPSAGGDEAVVDLEDHDCGTRRKGRRGSALGAMRSAMRRGSGSNSSRRGSATGAGQISVGASGGTDAAALNEPSTGPIRLPGPRVPEEPVAHIAAPSLSTQPMVSLSSEAAAPTPRSEFRLNQALAPQQGQPLDDWVRNRLAAVKAERAKAPGRTGRRGSAPGGPPGKPGLDAGTPPLQRTCSSARRGSAPGLTSTPLDGGFFQSCERTSACMSLPDDEEGLGRVSLPTTPRPRSPAADAFAAADSSASECRSRFSDFFSSRSSATTEASVSSKGESSVPKRRGSTPSAKGRPSMRSVAESSMAEASDSPSSTSRGSGFTPGRLSPPSALTVGSSSASSRGSSRAPPSPRVPERDRWLTSTEI